MNARQIIFIFIMFSLAMLILTIPLWAEGALPSLKEYMQSAVKMVNHLIELLDRTSRMMALEYRKRF